MEFYHTFVKVDILLTWVKHLHDRIIPEIG
jgi:hypothetical protein